MPQEIYNEGRVVGLSAWELFKREAEAEGVDPDVIPNEREWLASMIGSGASLILKIPVNTQAGVIDFPLPADSDLSTAGVVFATPFMGSCAWESSTYMGHNYSWATKIIGYNDRLIQNDAMFSPTSENVPGDSTFPANMYDDMVSNYMKITDGIVYIKGANWIPTGTTPNKDISPHLGDESTTTIIRLSISATLTDAVNILLTGFHNKAILQTFSGYAREVGGQAKYGSTDVENNDWKNGGMIGPEMFPWASKIIFSVPNYAYTNGSSIGRTLPKDVEYDTISVDNFTLFDMQDHTVNSAPVIDFDSIDLLDYLRNNNLAGSYSILDGLSKVNFGGKQNVGIITAWYPGLNNKNAVASATVDDFFPPAIYAGRIDTYAPGDNESLVPLDVAAPGTIKYFTSQTKATKYVTRLPANCAIYHNTTTNSLSFAYYDASTGDVNWASTVSLSYDTSLPRLNIASGDVTAGVVALTDSSGNSYGLDGSSGYHVVGPADSPSWNDMLTALKTNKKLEVLGPRLHAAGSELQMIHTESDNHSTFGMVSDNKIDYIGTRWIMLNPGDSDADPAWTDSVDPVTNRPNSVWVGVATYTDDPSGVRYLALNSGETPGTSIALGTQFMRFGNGLKLYISNTNPGTAGVPIGSIGIGW